MQNEDALDALSEAIVQLTVSNFFLGHVVPGVARVVGGGSWPLTTQLTAQGYTLCVAPEAFLRLTALERVVALEHELLHLVFHHPARALAHHPSDRERFGLACDLVVAQVLQHRPLLAGMVTIHHVDPMLPPDLTADAYFELLGGCVRGEHPAHSHMPHWARCCLAGVGAPGGSSPNPWAHAASPLGVQLADGLFDRLLYRAVVEVGGVRQIGRLPGHLLEDLTDFVRRWENVLDWKTVLRRFAASNRRSEVAHTLRRRSKRYGTFPGLRIRRTHRVAVCVDTSGSVGSEELERFFAEVDHIHRAGAEVEVLEADVRVQHRWRYRGKPPLDVRGRGGTSFDDALREVRESPTRFDACVYLTDGAGPAPSTGPGCPLLWILTGAAQETDHLRFGRVVHMATSVVDATQNTG